MLRYRELCRIGTRWASRPSHCAAGKSTASRLVVDNARLPQDDRIEADAATAAVRVAPKSPTNAFIPAFRG
jgi:hypothetical protein